MSTPAEHVGPGAPRGNTNYRSGRVYRAAMAKALEGRPDALEKIIKKALDQAEGGDAKARDHVALYVEDAAPPAPVNVQVNIVHVTVEMLRGLSDDELVALRTAYPVLKKLGLVGASGPGGPGAGEPAPA